MKTNQIFLLLGVSLATATVAQAQSSLESERRTNGKDTLKVFALHRAVFQKSSAVIYRGYKRTMYGVIMSEDGYILTKASELKPQVPASATPKPLAPLSIRIGDNVLYKDVKVVAIDASWDIALLKIDAKGLTPVKFAADSKIQHGSWAIANGATSRANRRARVGVISAETRKIDGKASVVMGVSLEDKDKKVWVRQISPKSGAADSDLKVGDAILKADGKDVKNRKEIVDLLGDKQPGETLTITYLRDGKEGETAIKLMGRPTADRPQRMGKNDKMSGRFSRRRDSFDRVLQVDIPMSETTCGGPLLNLKGECLGMVIARANRAETFAVPLEELKAVYTELKKSAK